MWLSRSSLVKMADSSAHVQLTLCIDPFLYLLSFSSNLA